MSEYIIQRETLESIANAVREKKGTTGLIPVSSLASEILSIESGGGDIGTGDYTVKVIDYDGAVLLEKKGNTGDVIDLPTVPTHEKLVFQEWSASVAVSDNKVTIADNDIIVGAVYTTVGGQNEFDITLTNATGLSVTLNMDGTKDWGDGTSDTETTHTYTAYGDYTIKCNGTKMTTSSDTRFFGQTNGSRGNYYCTAIRFVITDSITDYAFQNCYSLTSVVIPNSIQSISSYAFNNCYSLKSVVTPNSVKSIGSYAFSNCYSLTSVIISNSISSINTYTFNNCYSLTNIVIFNGVTKINNYAFYNCYSLIKYDFSQCSRVPTLSTNVFVDLNYTAKIIVPDSLYDSWIAASSWLSYEGFIYKASEVA